MNERVEYKSNLKARIGLIFVYNCQQSSVRVSC